MWKVILNKDKKKRNQLLNIDKMNKINRYDNDCEFQFIQNYLDKMGYHQLDGNKHIYIYILSKILKEKFILIFHILKLLWNNLK